MQGLGQSQKQRMDYKMSKLFVPGLCCVMKCWKAYYEAHLPYLGALDSPPTPGFITLSGSIASHL